MSYQRKTTVLRPSLCRLDSNKKSKEYEEINHAPGTETQSEPSYMFFLNTPNNIYLLTTLIITEIIGLVISIVFVSGLHIRICAILIRFFS